MKGVSKIIIISIILVLLIGGFIFYLCQKSEKESSQGKVKNINMKLTSPAFENNQSIPERYTCDGEDINPPLQMTEIPEGAKSLVLIVDDPDAPLGTWSHWIVWNIDPSTSLIEENSLPEGAVQGKNSFGKQSYGGPCPPIGTHRYFFKLYALDKMLELDSFSKKEEVEKSMEGHILDRVELVGLYQRQQ